MKCPQCGHENNEKRRYCEECGEYLFPEEEYDKTTQIHHVETVVKSDKKKVLKRFFTGIILTFVLTAGFFIYEMYGLQKTHEQEIKTLEKEKKELQDKIDTQKNKNNETQLDKDEEILELTKETKEQAEKISDLEEQIAQLEEQLNGMDEQSSDEGIQTKKNESSGENTSTKKKTNEEK